MIKVPPSNPLELTDFSGGLTDKDMLQDKTRYLAATNLFPTKNNKLKTRPGSQIYNSTNYRTNEQIRINGLINFRAAAQLLITTKQAIYQSTVGTPGTATSGSNRLQNTDSSTTLFTADNSTPGNANISYSEWNSHLLITNDAYSRPLKLYVDSGGVMRVRTAGLPKIPETENYTPATLLTNAIALAAEIRTDMTAHFASTGYHLAADTIAAALLDATVMTTEAHLILVTNSLISAYKSHLADASFIKTFHVSTSSAAPAGGVFATIAQQTLELPVEMTSLIPTSTFECALLLDDLKVKYNTHNGHYLTHKFNFTHANIVTTAFLYPSKGPRPILSSPEYTLSGFYTALNLLKVRYNFHIGDTSQNRHTIANDGTNTVTSADATTPETLETLLEEMRHDYGDYPNGINGIGHQEDADAGGTNAWHALDETTSHKLSPRPAQATIANDRKLGVHAGDLAGFVTAYNELRTKFEAHVQDTQPHAALYADYFDLPSVLNITLGTWSYAFYYHFEYTNGTTSQIDRGPVRIKVYKNVIDPSQNPMRLQSIPAITNAGYSNASWDTATIKVKIYRTIESGATLYFAGEVTNGTTTFTDRLSDAEIINNEPLYTTGGVLSNDLPPKAKYVHIVDGYAYYGNFTDEDGVIYKNRILQSKNNDIDSVPGQFILDFEEEVKGIYSIGSRRVVGTTAKIYRVDGVYTDTGDGGMTYEIISDSVGLLAQNSFVRTDIGLFFAGTDGFYRTDGINVIPITDFFTFYQSLSNKGNISGIYDEQRRLIHWAVQVDSGGSDNDSWLTLDLNKPIGPFKSCFTLSNGGGDFAPTVLGYFGNQILRGDTRGYFFKHDDSYTTDPDLNTAVAASSWLKNTIIHDFRTTYLNITDAVRKWSTGVALNFIKETNLSLDVIENIDKGAVTKTLQPILLRTSGYLQNTVASSTPPHKRSSAAGSLRFWNKQVRLTNNYAVIKTWQDLVVGNIDAILKTLTIASGAFASDDRNYYIYFEATQFVTGYLITGVAAGVLTYADAGNTSVTATSQRWVIRGYPKDEILHLESITLYAQPLTPSQLPYPGKVTGDL